MHNGRERLRSGNWHDNSGPSDYHYMDNSGDPSNGNWNGNRRSHGQNQNNSFNRDVHGGRGHGDESFTKFRDQNQQQPQFHKQQLHNQRQGQGGGGRQNNIKTPRQERRGRHKEKMARRNNRNEQQTRGGRGGRGGGGGGRDRRSNIGTAVGPWYQDPMPNDEYHFTNGQLGNENIVTPPVEPPLPPPTPEAPKETALAIAVPTETEKPIALINAANIKKEKEQLSKQPTKPEASSEDSSSSSSDESVEAGEVVKAKLAKKTEAAVTQKAKVKTEAVAKPVVPPSSSSEDDSSDENASPVKGKGKVTGKESASKSPKSIKKYPSEDDVVCMGNESRKYTILDDEDNNEEEETDGSSDAERSSEQKTGKGKDKAGHICGICDKKGHTSFECQMICRNCSAPYHSLKNCPNPPNLSIALQAFMEFSMQQLTAFNVDKRFAFPAGVFPTVPVLPSAPVQNPGAVKSKKEKRSANKKTKKMTKKIKVEAHNSDDDDDEDDDDDDDDEAEADASTESESSESSAEPQPAVNKTKRKRSSKQAASNMTPAAAFPFPLMAAGAPYNPMMYPYGAPFSFPK